MRCKIKQISDKIRGQVTLEVYSAKVMPKDTDQ